MSKDPNYIRSRNARARESLTALSEVEDQVWEQIFDSQDAVRDAIKKFRDSDDDALYALCQAASAALGYANKRKVLIELELSEIEIGDNATDD